jgi:hypothetical protein
MLLRFGLLRQKNIYNFLIYFTLDFLDHLCDLVVRVPAYRSRGPCSIPGAHGFSEKPHEYNSGDTWKKKQRASV